MDNPNSEQPIEEVAREDTGPLVRPAPVTDPTFVAAETPPVVAEPAHATEWARPKPKNNLARTVLIALILLSLGAASGIVIYKAYFEKATTTTTTNAQTNTSTVSGTTTKTASATDVIAILKTKVKAPEVPTTVNTSISSALTQEGNFAGWSVPRLQPSGYSFYTVPTQMTGFTLASNSEDIVQTDMLTIRTYLNELGLVSTEASFDATNEIQGSSEFTSASLRCVVAETSYSYKQGAHQAQLGCADTSSYIDNAKTLLPLFKVYIASNPNQNTVGVLFNSATITSSPVAGYKRASVSTGNIFWPVGGGVAWFYMTPDSSWHYFGTTQDQGLCSDYKTAEQKNAFSGVACALENGSQSTVKP